MGGAYTIDWVVAIPLHEGPEEVQEMRKPISADDDDAPNAEKSELDYDQIPHQDFKFTEFFKISISKINSQQKNSNRKKNLPRTRRFVTNFTTHQGTIICFRIKIKSGRCFI